jgi:DNA polymerase-3 subunit epsilon
MSPVPSFFVGTPNVRYAHVMSIHAVIDFETTGLSPAFGARPTKIAIVFIADGNIIDRVQSLMNLGVSIPNDIQVLTGITNDMVHKAPGSRQ